jgi:glutamine amidotransferase
VIAVVDAGLGNLRSVGKALAHVGATVEITSDPRLIARADRVVMPGQGAFGDGSRALDRDAPLGLAIRDAIERGRPYLGICLGMQILFDASEESPTCRGLGIFPGRVVKIAGGIDPATGARLKIPHMGWNEVAGAGHPLLPESDEAFYFVHSYHAVPVEESIIAGRASYGALAITAAVARKNIFAVQFHPEKSQRAGLELLAAFSRWEGA